MDELISIALRKWRGRASRGLLAGLAPGCYAYFNHSAHVNRGVSCVECHGKVNEMDTVTHMQPLSMILHELATNAAKYGALSVQDGMVDLRWSGSPSAWAPTSPAPR